MIEKELERVLDLLDPIELEIIWETFCEENAPQDLIYRMTPNDLDENLRDYSPSEILEMSKAPNFNINDKYWAFDTYDEKDILVSSNSYKSLILIDKLVQHIINTKEDYDNEKIKDVLKGIK